MTDPIPARLAVCGTSAAARARARSLVEAAGPWPILEVAASEAPAADALTSVEVYLVATDGDAPAEDLITFLSRRREGVPLVVVGNNPARMAMPDLWLATPPPPALFRAVLVQLLGDASGSKPHFRRKGDMIVGNSQAVRDLLHTLDHLAPSKTPVLITGESGVGKELVARALHYSSPRASAPFIAINCGAVPETLFEAELFGYHKGAFTGAVGTHVGAFEAADRGSLFLDEIGEMPMAMQVKLLRVLQTSAVQPLGATEPKHSDFRLVTATNRDLEAEVKAGRFREDLFYRIHVYPVHVPPLRERPEDIAPIVRHHLSLIATRDKRPALRVSSSALEKLIAHSWPGNVRELINLLERAALLAGSDIIDAEHIVLPSAKVMQATGAPPSYRDAKTRFELDYYSQVLRIADGNVSLAAKLAQKTRKEIYDALKRLGLEATAFRTEDETRV